MPKITIDVDYDDITTIVREELMEVLDMQMGEAPPFDDDAINYYLNKLIAYYSVPGTWKEGMYDDDI